MEEEDERERPERPERPFQALGPVTPDDHGPVDQAWLDSVAQDRERFGVGRTGFRISEADSYARAMSGSALGEQEVPGDLLSKEASRELFEMTRDGQHSPRLR